MASSGSNRNNTIDPLKWLAFVWKKWIAFVWKKRLPLGILFTVVIVILYIASSDFRDYFRFLTLGVLFVGALSLAALTVRKWTSTSAVLLSPIFSVVAMIIVALLFMSGKIWGITDENRKWAILAASIVAFLAIIGILVNPDTRYAWVEAGIGIIVLLFVVALIGASCAVIRGLAPFARQDPPDSTSTPTPIPVPTRTTFFLPSEKTECAKDTLSTGQNVVVVVVLRETEDNRRVAHRHEAMLLGDPQLCGPIVIQGDNADGIAYEAVEHPQALHILPAIPIQLLRGEGDELAVEFARQLAGAIAIYVLDGDINPSVTITPPTIEPTPTDTRTPSPSLTPTSSPTKSPTASPTLTPSITPSVTTPSITPTTPTPDISGTPTTLTVTPTRSAVVPPLPTDTVQVISPSPTTCRTQLSSRIKGSTSRARYNSRVLELFATRRGQAQQLN